MRRWMKWVALVVVAVVIGVGLSTLLAPETPAESGDTLITSVTISRSSVTKRQVIAAFETHGIALATKKCKPDTYFVEKDCITGSGIIIVDQKAPETTATLAPDAGKGEAFDVLILDGDAKAFDADAAANSDGQAKTITSGDTTRIYRNNILVLCKSDCAADAEAITEALNDL